MAKNTGDGFRRGAITGRTQFRLPDGRWMKRDESIGRFLDRKETEGPWKGVAKEPDGRDTDKA